MEQFSDFQLNKSVFLCYTVNKIRSKDICSLVALCEKVENQSLSFQVVKTKNQLKIKYEDYLARMGTCKLEWKVYNVK